MTLTTPARRRRSRPGTPGPHTPPDAVHCTIDGFDVAVPKGTLIIRAAEQIGVQIPRFCDHPLLEPVGACRQCLVEVEGQRKPVASCTMPVTEGMVVKTQLTSPEADKAQQGTMELLLINHPLDCPVCDKGGECPLQNQAMSNGRTESRFVDVKRTYPKPLPISSQVLLDRERCVLCARCTRFSQQVAGDPFIELFERGALEQVAIYEDEPFESYFSGNTTQICPVGALTSAAVPLPRPPVRPAQRAQRLRALRVGLRPAHRLPARQGHPPARRRRPRGQRGVELRQGPLRVPLRHARTPGSRRRWCAARTARCSPRPGPRPGRSPRPACSPRVRTAGSACSRRSADRRGRLRLRQVRPRRARHQRRRRPRPRPLGGGGGVPRRAPSPARPRHRCRHLRRPVERLRRPAGRVRARGGVADRLPAAAPGGPDDGAAGLRPRAVRHAGRREAAGHRADHAARRGGAVAARARRRQLGRPGRRRPAAAGRGRARRRAAGRGARRPVRPPRARAGDRGPRGLGAAAGGGARRRRGGRAAEPAARRPRRRRRDRPRRRRRRSGAPSCPSSPGPRHDRHPHRRPRRPARPALLVGGVDPADLPDPALAEAALASAGFVVSLEMFPSAVTEWADVVLPVAAAAEKAGSYLDWEGRVRSFDATLHGTGQLPDGRVLQGLADEMDVDLRLPTPEAARAELAALGAARRPGEGAGLDVAPEPAPDLRDGRGGPRHLASAARRRHAAAATSPSWPAPPARRWPGSARTPRAGSASPTATG